jgi:CPA1 family monovalent cation:H+ antiporter
LLTVIVARFAWLGGSELLLRGLRRIGWAEARPLGWRQASILGWAGMRGVVTLAIALTLPQSMPARELMLVTAFAVIFVTVVVQGTSLGWLIRKVQPVDEDPPAKLSMAAAEARIAGARAAVVEVQAYDAEGNLIHPQLLAQTRKRLEVTERYASDAETFMAGIRSHFDVVLASIAAGREELIRVHRAGLIEDEVLHELERDLDVEELGILLQRGE